MNEHFLEHLENTGLVRNGAVNKSRIARLSLSKLADIAEESTEITSAEYLNREVSVFAHSASLSLGGDRTDYCGTLSCRLKRSYQLAQFASLYSDRVYIRSFSAKYLPRTTGMYRDIEHVFRSNLAEDLTIIAELEPLISKGIVVPFSPPTAYCPCCLAKLYLGTDFAAPFEDAYQQLQGDYLNKVSYVLRWLDGGYHLDKYGPETLIDHKFAGFEFLRLPPEYLKFPQLLKKARGKSGVELSKEQVSQLNLHKEEADRVIETIAFELTAAQTLNTSFLTDSSLHIDFLNSINQNPAVERRNRIAQKYLTSFVPFLSDVSPKDLVSLRENEQEAFVIYRQSLNKAIDDYKAIGNGFNETDARALYSDVIAPKLAGLDRKVKAAKRTLVKETVRETAAWVGAISFGVYMGIIPAHLIEAAKLLGMTKLLAEFLKTTMGRRDVENDIRNEDMYFLWRVRERAG